MQKRPGFLEFCPKNVHFMRLILFYKPNEGGVSSLASPSAPRTQTMDHVTLNNGVEMPILGYGVFQIND